MTNTGTNKTQADPVGKGTLECYKCSSFRKEHHCDNPSEDKTPTVVCEADEHMCRKVEQHSKLWYLSFKKEFFLIKYFFPLLI